MIYLNLENLKQARKKAGLTQKEVADKLGLQYTTYRNYEQGQREPNNKTILALSNLFNVSTDYLLGKEDPLEALNLSPVGKAIVQLYISLPPQERTALAEHIISLSEKK
ncbi:MAG: helix-turn-helix domain-containing protein [Oscillospiraceae bacterium]|nr:helix-turn-helix domain-containing protein [Oscillospiraceae bacterium]